jgi:hypothetical protein
LTEAGYEAPKPSRRTLAALLVAGVAAGAGLSTDTRHSEPQIVSGRAIVEVTPSGSTERWRRGEVTVTIDESMSAIWPDVALGVADAFHEWHDTGAKLPSVLFESRAAKPLVLEPDGENRIYYVPITIAGHQHDLGMTLQHVSASTGEIVEADIVINSNHPFSLLDASDNCSDSYDIESVVMHEAGHFWGLREDMTDAGAAMYFSTAPCNIAKRTLKVGDTLAISSLYAKELADDDTNSPAAAGLGHCSVASPPNRSACNGFAIAALVVVLGGFRLVNRRAARRSREFLGHQ